MSVPRTCHCALFAETAACRLPSLAHGPGPVELLSLSSSLSSSNELKAIFGCGHFTMWSHERTCVLGCDGSVGTWNSLGVHMSTILVAFHACPQPHQDLHQRMGMGGTEATAAARAQRLDTGGDNLPSQTSCESKEDKNQGGYISPTYPHTPSAQTSSFLF